MLAQVGALLPMLKRGIGVHHSGLLPILKEVIEIMFQENLIKVLPLVNPHSLPHNSHANTTRRPICSMFSTSCDFRAKWLYHRQ